MTHHMLRQCTYWIGIAALIGCLSGCVGVFLAGAATGGLIVYDSRSMQTISDDMHIRYVIGKRLEKEPTLKKTNITATAFHYSVLLVGQTPTIQQKKTAEKIARTVPGVRVLYNEIQIMPPIPLSTQSKDTWITAKVRTELLGTKQLRSGDIKVLTENGTVYLMGKVSRSQADLAVQVSRQVSGIKRVVKVFQTT